MPQAPTHVESLTAIQNPFAAYTLATRTSRRRRALRGAEDDADRSRLPVAVGAIARCRQVRHVGQDAVFLMEQEGLRRRCDTQRSGPPLNPARFTARR